MSRYRKVPVATWDKAFFRALTTPQPNGQTLWLYFVSGPLTTSIPGLVPAGAAALAEGLGWPLQKFLRAFRELEAQQLAQADWAARVVWIPSVLDDNRPESPNVLRAWRSAFDELPDCPLTAKARATVEALVEGLTEPFRKAFAEGSRKTFGKTLPNQKAEAVTETESGAGVRSLPSQPTHASHSRSNGSSKAAPPSRHVDAWSESEVGQELPF
ncbi:MAG TPA: hypothetical protein VER78_07950 [Thermoanaerobaculia bacterium]|nr:hypothetical protein [Thermoanaerobaculia bacterium]